MFLAGLFITVPYSVSYLAFAITAKADCKPPIHAKIPFLYSSLVPKLYRKLKTPVGDFNLCCQDHSGSGNNK